MTIRSEQINADQLSKGGIATPPTQKIHQTGDGNPANVKTTHGDVKLDNERAMERGKGGRA
jgi:hypothetical protein